MLYEATGAAVFIDPLLPPDPAELWPALDERVSDRPVVVLTTIQWHGRSRDAFAQRYRAGSAPPPGVEPFVVPRADETIFWLPEHRTLVPGDRIIGAAGGGLRLCPVSWLSYLPDEIGLEELRLALLPLLELPVERVLVSHGEPVLAGGREALAEALA